jgi:hypothetical protein
VNYKFFNIHYSRRKYQAVLLRKYGTWVSRKPSGARQTQCTRKEQSEIDLVAIKNRGYRVLPDVCSEARQKYCRVGNDMAFLKAKRQQRRRAWQQSISAGS